MGIVFEKRRRYEPKRKIAGKIAIEETQLLMAFHPLDQPEDEESFSLLLCYYVHF